MDNNSNFGQLDLCPLSLFGSWVSAAPTSQEIVLRLIWSEHFSSLSISHLSFRSRQGTFLVFVSVNPSVLYLGRPCCACLCIQIYWSTLSLSAINKASVGGTSTWSILDNRLLSSFSIINRTVRMNQTTGEIVLLQSPLPVGPPLWRWLARGS